MAAAAARPAAARDQPPRLGRLRRRAPCAPSAARRGGRSAAPASSPPAARTFGSVRWRLGASGRAIGHRALRRRCVAVPARSRARPAPAGAVGRRSRRPGRLRRGSLRPQEGIRVPDRRRRAARAGTPAASAGAGRRRRPARRVRGRIAERRSRRIARPAGVLHQDDVAAGLAAADVVVVPSVRDPSGNVDGLPNVVLEALASGTPLVATPAGGIGSVVRDGQTGCSCRRPTPTPWPRRSRACSTIPLSAATTGARRAAVGRARRRLVPGCRRLRAGVRDRLPPGKRPCLDRQLAMSPQPSARAQRLLPRLQRQRHDREPGHSGGPDREHADARLRSHRRQRRQLRRDGRDRRRARGDVPARAGGSPSEESRLRRRAAERVSRRRRRTYVFYTDGDAQYDPAEMACSGRRCATAWTG